MVITTLFQRQVTPPSFSGHIVIQQNLCWREKKKKMKWNKIQSFSTVAPEGGKEKRRCVPVYFFCQNFFPSSVTWPKATFVGFFSLSPFSLSCLRICLCVTMSLINAKRGSRSLRRKTNKPNRHVVYTSLPPISFLNKPTHNKQTQKTS